MGDRSVFQNSPAIPLKVYIEGKGFPILCLHGHPGSGSSLSVFTDHLSNRFQTIAPDLRGYGKSRFNSNFEMSDHLNDLESLIDRLQIEKCLILGWSLGGILAMELALRLSERVTGLILVATAARPRGNHPPITWQDNFYTGVTSILNLIKPGWQWNIEKFGKRSLFRYLIQQHTATTYKYIAKDAVSAYLQTSASATRALYTAIKAGYNRLADLEQIQCPALVLAGSQDRHITPDSSIETARHLQNCQWQCYANTAHLFPWEIPNQVLSDIDYWLEANPEIVNYH
ncbi:MAG: alpha/beta hydrolase [Pelatocladus maniniholoensis HA4357-MV3]|jgi:pimeloyl-ACP methyl ester carboxylesterase|uniref:Alpha/beta hydrolase n=1 Tax=Pelatocladus maniniholoensis HA4357-MV3 TaxID=1117104 RepID=A0A9E3LTZ8_9NOST|nr:alpha/beta hydrolase [Pelatocladus maniniholoensis HA4357-MV3]BAZ68174.1 alpha/beta hydrolase fold protein [Fischerella sp. NIES-4106]